MSALSRFEQFIEQFLEGSFTRLMRSQLQPVEIAKKLARAMEDSQAVSTGGKIAVANRYDVLLNPQDFALFEPYKANLERELEEYAVAAAKERQFVLVGNALVSISSSSSAMPKRPLVKASKADVGNTVGATPSPSAEDDAAALAGQTSRLNLNLRPATHGRTRAHLQLLVAGKAEKIPVNRLPYSIGRSLDNDLVLEDIRVSRHHARIEEINRRLLLVDLRSTNGTSVNGDRVSRCLLSHGDVISLGGLELLLALEERD